MERADGTLIRGRWVVTDWTEPPATGVLDYGAIYEEAGIVVEVGSYEALNRTYPSAKRIGDLDSIVIPGFVNAHSHGRGVSTFQRGQPDEPLELRVLESVHRSQHGARVDPHLDVLCSCMKQIASGITTTVHSHSYYQGPIEGYAHGVRSLLHAYRESGMRSVVALGIRDRNRFSYPEDDDFAKAISAAGREAMSSLGPSTYVPFDEYLALLSELEREEPQAAFQFGPTNPVWCSERLLGGIADASRQTGRRVHTHLAETKYQARFARKAYGKDWSEALSDLGLLSERLSCAHGVWLRRHDLPRLAQARTQIVHNPASNLRLSSGIAPLRRFLEYGVPVAIGTDSLAMNDDDDIFQDIRLAALLQNVPGVDREPLTASALFGMATRGGAMVAGIPNIGVLAAGAPADIVLLSARKLAGLPDLEPLPLADWLLARGKASAVHTVMIGGRLVLQDGVWKTIDAERIAEGLRQAPGSAATRGDDSIRPLKASVRDYYQHSIPPGDRLYTYNDCE